MEIRFTILAKDKEGFDVQLNTKMIDILNKIAMDNTKILAIQFKDADEFAINSYLDSFRRFDGQYTYDGKFWYYRDELRKLIEPYCKTCSISIAEKYLEANYPESEKQKRFGYINFAEYKIGQPKIKELK